MTPHEFEAMARDPEHWQRTAREFAVAASYLGDWYDSDSAHAGMTSESWGTPVPMMFLYALSVENLLKAISVATGYDPMSRGQLSRDFATHDLIRHAREAGLELTVCHHDLLDQLESVIRSGKYPIAKKHNADSSAWRFRLPGDVENIWSLLQLLEDHLYATAKSNLPKRDFRIRYRPVGAPEA